LAARRENRVSLHNLRLIIARCVVTPPIPHRLDLLFTHEDAPTRAGCSLALARARLAVRVSDLLGCDADTLRRWQAWHRRAAGGRARRWPRASRPRAREATAAFSALLPRAIAVSEPGIGYVTPRMLRCGRAADAPAPLVEALQSVIDARAVPRAHGRRRFWVPWPRGLDGLAPSLRDALHALAEQSALLRGMAPTPQQLPPMVAVDDHHAGSRGASAGAIAAGDSNKLIARALDISRTPSSARGQHPRQLASVAARPRPAACEPDLLLELKMQRRLVLDSQRSRSGRWSPARRATRPPNRPPPRAQAQRAGGLCPGREGQRFPSAHDGGQHRLCSSTPPARTGRARTPTSRC
jgi:hypothetical protein